MTYTAKVLYASTLESCLDEGYTAQDAHMSALRNTIDSVAEGMCVHASTSDHRPDRNDFVYILHTDVIMARDAYNTCDYRDREVVYDRLLDVMVRRDAYNETRYRELADFCAEAR